MADTGSTVESVREWIVDHKLRTVGNQILRRLLFLASSLVFCCLIFGDNVDLLEGCLWLSGIASSIAYNWSRPNMKTSVKIIHAR